MATAKLAEAIAQGDIDKAMNLIRSCKNSSALHKLVQASHSLAITEAANLRGETALVYTLLCYGADFRNRNHEPLRRSVKHQDLGTILTLLKDGYTTERAENESDLIPADILNLAIETCPEETAVEMLEHYHARFSDESIPLAIEAGSFHILHALMKAGAAGENGWDGSLLVNAAKAGNALVMRLLLEHGPYPVEAYEKALEAARKARAESLTGLIREYSRLSAMDELRVATRKLPSIGVSSWF